MTRLGSPEADILAWLVEHDHVTASEIGQACGIAVASIRGRLRILEWQKLVIGMSNSAVSPTRIYTITAEGRRKIEP